MKNFQAYFPWFWDFFLEYPKTMKFRDLQGSVGEIFDDRF
jgi:hypothetical protein